jgi:hypothetical protein
MPLLGKASMLLGFDIDEPAIAEHDDWHTHEHLPERLSIPGFLRGTRWVALRGSPRYAVLYEVESLETLGSPAYLERLNHPTPWTSKMMRHYQGMTRGLCTVEASSGRGLGHFAWIVRFNIATDSDSPARAWLTEQIPGLSSRPGLGSVHLLRGALDAAMTTEQRIRGADSGVNWALIATGYDFAAVAALEQGDLAPGMMQARGMTNVSSAVYQAAYSVSADG